MESDHICFLAKDGILLSNEELEEICGLDLKMPREAYVTDKNYYVLRQEMEKADCSVLSVSEYNGIMDLKSGLVLFVILFCISWFFDLLQRYLNKKYCLSDTRHSGYDECDSEGRFTETYAYGRKHSGVSGDSRAIQQND